MDGSCGTLAPSLSHRFRPTETVPPPLPRRVLRHLVFAHGLGVGSRVVAGGDASASLAAFLDRLAIDAETAGHAPLKAGEFDAAVWLDLTCAPTGERSLLSAAALGRSAGLLGAVKPLGSLVLVARIGEEWGGHDVGCLERHLAVFPGRVRVASFFDRTPESLAATFTGRSHPGYAVASFQTPPLADAALWRRKATAAACGLAVPCCRWAAEAGSGPRRRAA